MKKIYLLLSFLVISVIAFAQQGTWDWGGNGVYTLNNGPVVQSELWVTGADVSGDGYVTGGYWGNLTIDGHPLNNNGTDYYNMLMKYDSSGNFQWVVQSTPLNADLTNTIAYDIATDNSDHVYLTGIFTDTILFGKDTAFAPKRFDELFLLKYDKNGNAVWSRESTSDIRAAGGEGTALTVHNNDVYVAGVLKDTISLGATKLTNKRGGFFIAKYDTAGNLIWAKNSTKFAYGGVSFTGNPLGPYSITTDKFNNIFMTGLFEDTLAYGATSLYAPANEESFFVLKFDSNANLKWAAQGVNDSSFESDPVYVATDNNGYAYCGGSYSGTASFGSTTLPTISPENNFFIVKYDTSGNLVWVKTTKNSKNSKWVLCKMASDNNNHLYVGSRGDNDSIVYDNTPITTSQSGNGDGYSSIFKTDTAGNLLCSSLITAGGDDMNGMAVDASGKYVFLGGDLLEQMILNSTDTLYKGGSQFGPQEVPFIARWKPCASCNLAVTAPQLTTLCDGQSTTLVAGGGSSYTWSPSSGLSATTGSSVVASPTVTTTYTIIGSDSSCTGTAQAIVTVIQSPNKPTFTQHNDTLISSSLHDNQWYRNGRLLNNDTSRYLVIDTLGWYYVEVNNETNGCSTASDSSDITTLVTGINQLSANTNHLFIYPNPASNQLIVESGQGTVSGIVIANVLGQVVYKSIANTHTNTNPNLVIDVSVLPDGLYFISVTTDTGMVTQKFIKERVEQ